MMVGGTVRTARVDYANPLSESKDAKRREFSDLLHEAFHDGVKSVLGESCFRAFSTLYLRSNQSPTSPRALHENLVSVFTDRGALILEKVVVKCLYQRLNVSYQERSDFEFERYVSQAKRIYEDMARLEWGTRSTP